MGSAGPGGWLVLVLLSGVTARVSASTSLDAILSCLETNGVLVDRSRAVRGGIEGILRSIDPGALVGISPEAADGVDAGVTQAVDRVELWPENLAYLRVRGLIPGSGEEILAQLRTLEQQAGIVLDLRNASGADLQSVAILAGLAYPAQTPLYVLTDNRGQPVSTNRVETAAGFRVPLMVLIDGKTRGAAEALAALWRGKPGIMLLGSATPGNPRFRDILTLPDGQVITLATRKLLPLQGESYDSRGVEPDVVVAPLAPVPTGIEAARTNRMERPRSAKTEQDLELMKRVGEDAVLQRATDILLGLRTLSGYGLQ